MTEKKPFLAHPPRHAEQPTELEILVRQLHPQGLPSNIRRSIRAYRSWMDSDDAIIRHLRLLMESGWSSAIIRDLSRLSGPALHAPAVKLVGLQRILERRGFSTTEAIQFVIRHRVLHVERPADEIERLLEIVLHGLDVTISKLFLKNLNAKFVLMLSEQELKDLIENLRKDFSISQIVTSKLTRYARSIILKRRAQATAKAAE